ncbi:hypothetical protein CAOG_08301 [Capsaspora owczarzaki ATCC 30864]|uniref:hypothetical protein n=1 Tax=Capsaspora owczarzaki (strain ATCC 30864) TaxID=595528 RepID=UPI0001FE2861|nr:hypothetical protein CAOG_08301 [Capsaspora owczarzaki ATCC 30864]|eukprot:XP_004341908.1 hypothetical protein CAOG_08301 [Capsaspora owczarzaki ATCC 30864]
MIGNSVDHVNLEDFNEQTARNWLRTDWTARRAILDDLVNKQLLKKAEHAGLVLYNYTDKCDRTKAWSTATINARGTIFDDNTGVVVGRAFSKFFNIGEHEVSKFENLPTDQPSILEKLDGSLGIHYRNNNKHCIATRGSFISPQAEHATAQLNSAKYIVDNIPHNINILLEIIYPENRVVIDYGSRDELVLLSAYYLDSLEELTASELLELSVKTQIPLPQQTTGTILEMIERAATIRGNEEGWVVKYNNGLRVKVKGLEFKRLHALKGDVSPLRVWTLLSSHAVKENQFEAFLQKSLEDWEMKQEAKQIYDRFTSDIQMLEGAGKRILAELAIDRTKITDRAYRAEAMKKINKLTTPLRRYLIASVSGSNEYDILWNMLKPVNNRFIETKELIK